MASNPPGVLQLKFRIRSYEVDMSGVLGPLTVVNYLQEAASRHAQELGFGIDDLARQGYLWVLTHLNLELNALPPSGEEVVVTTWPTRVVRLYAGRQFRIQGTDGQLLVRAATAWLILDARRRRPVRAAEILARIPSQPEDPQMPIVTGKLPVQDQMKGEKVLHVRRRDLDINHHVNNGVYIEWLLESLPADLPATHRLARLDVNYLAESGIGDEIYCRWTPLDPPARRYYHSLAKAGTGPELVRAHTQWRAKA